jgi:protein gp37
MARRLACMGFNQYQEVIGVERNGIIKGEWNGTTAFVASELEKPYKWRKHRTVFISSMGDLFHDSVPFAWVDKIMECAFANPQHTYIFLTKRPERMQTYMAKEVDKFLGVFFATVPWIICGVSVEDQQTADERIPFLMHTPAAKRFISLEPMVGPVNLNGIHETGETEHGGAWGSWESCLNGKRFDPWSDGMIDGFPKLDGVIVGGESGNKARTLCASWVRSIRDQCAAAGVPFMFKQASNHVMTRDWELENGFPTLDYRIHSELAWEVRS